MQEEIKNLLLGNENYLKAAIEIYQSVKAIKDENNKKIETIFHLLDKKMEDLTKIVGATIEKRWRPDGDYNLFKLFVHEKNISIVVCTDEDLGCYPYTERVECEFSNWKKLKNPYNADEFVDAFICDLKQLFKR